VNRPDDEDSTIYEVVINYAWQYSLPWSGVGKTARTAKRNPRLH
jgi:hypothetical protein